MTDIRIEGEVRCTIPFDDQPDWYVLEKGEPGSKDWGVSDACVEGTGEHMLGLASAILAGGVFHAKRCACQVTKNRVLLWSPRNSQDAGSITHAAGKALAEQIIELLGSKKGAT